MLCAPAECENLHEDLANLQCEMSIKEKLIEELELSQKRLHAMKCQYEDKLVNLQQQIKGTELERDRIIANLGLSTPSALYYLSQYMTCRLPAMCEPCMVVVVSYNHLTEHSMCVRVRLQGSWSRTRRRRCSRCAPSTRRS